MKQPALYKFVDELSSIWRPVDSLLTKQSKQLLEELVVNSKEEPWVINLLNNNTPVKEIYRSAEHGFILMAHVESKGESSPPHDHGNGWVIYATVTGKVEMSVYNKVKLENGEDTVVQKDVYTQLPGQSHVYLPGDIHSTRTLENKSLMLRLTSCDFQQELAESRLKRYSNDFNKW